MQQFIGERNKLNELIRILMMGASFKDNDILKLPQGAGYFWLREAFFSVLNYIDTLAEHVILAGHIKD